MKDTHKKAMLILAALFAPIVAFPASTSHTTTARDGTGQTDYYYVSAPSTVQFTTSWFAYGDSGGYYGVTGGGGTVYSGNYGPGTGSNSGSGPANNYLVGQNASAGPGGYATITTTASW